MKRFPGIPGAQIVTRVFVKQSWLDEHPGEEPPDTEIEIAIVVMAMEVRHPSVITAPGQDEPPAQQRGWPVVELARIPYYAWRRKMDQLFNVENQGERTPDEQGSSAGPGDTIS